MGKYYLKSSTGYDSEFEDDNGERYLSQETIGKGTFCSATRFVSKNNSVVVLKPFQEDRVTSQEINCKYDFFKALYPDKIVELFQETGNVRLVIPFFSGQPYLTLRVRNLKELIGVFFSAIDALEDAHKKGYAVIDFKDDNILYDKNTGKSVLIDGGCATQIQTPFIRYGLNNHLYLRSRASINEAKAWLPHIARECWSNLITANALMDIYALGFLMWKMAAYQISPNLDEHLTGIIMRCMHPYPPYRTQSLSLLKRELSDYSHWLEFYTQYYNRLNTHINYSLVPISQNGQHPDSSSNYQGEMERQRNSNQLFGFFSSNNKRPAILHEETNKHGSTNSK